MSLADCSSGVEFYTIRHDGNAMPVTSHWNKVIYSAALCRNKRDAADCTRNKDVLFVDQRTPWDNDLRER